MNFRGDKVMAGDELPIIGSPDTQKAVPPTVKVVPVNTTVSTTNPSYTATCVLFTYNPLSGKVGERSDTSVEFQATGLIVKATT